MPGATLKAGSWVWERTVLFVAIGVQAVARIMSLASSTILLDSATLGLPDRSQSMRHLGQWPL